MSSLKYGKGSHCRKEKVYYFCLTVSGKEHISLLVWMPPISTKEKGFYLRIPLLLHYGCSRHLFTDADLSSITTLISLAFEILLVYTSQLYLLSVLLAVNMPLLFLRTLYGESTIAADVLCKSNGTRIFFQISLLITKWETKRNYISVVASKTVFKVIPRCLWATKCALLCKTLY